MPLILKNTKAVFAAGIFQYAARASISLSIGPKTRFNGRKAYWTSCIVASFTIFLLTTGTAEAAARTASVTGDWNNIATWGGTGIPGAADSVTVNSGIIVTVPSGYAAKCTTINFTTGAVGQASIALTDNTSSLTASGAVAIQRPGNGGVANQINIGAGTFSAASVALSGTSGGVRLSQILISTGTVNVTGNITSSGVDSQLLFSGSGTLNAGGTFLSGTAGTFTASTGTVNYNAAGAQTVGVYTYFNLILSGSGAKSIATGTLVGGNLSIAPSGTATASIGAGLNIIVDTLTLGGTQEFNGTWGSSSSIATNKNDTYFAATTGYLTASAIRYASVSGDWDNTATWGGAPVPIAGDRVNINADITVTVPIGYDAYCTSISFASATATASSVTLEDATSSLNLSGAATIARPSSGVNQIDVGNGIFSAASMALAGTTGGTSLTQLLISSGTVAITGTISSVGVDSRITFSGDGELTIGGNFMSGTVGTFTEGTSTVIFNAAAAQTVGAYKFNNITLGGSGAKTTTGATVNGVLSMEGTATASVIPAYGANATLHYNTATSRTAGAEWATPFVGSGGVIIDNTGTITLGIAKVFNAGIPLLISNGATLATGNFSLTLGGNFVNDGGTFIGGSAPVVIANTMAVQSIDGFTTTGTVSMTKTVGTATFTDNVSGGGFTINGTGGTLNLGTGLTHTFTGTWTRTNGTLNGGSSTLKIGSSVSGTGGTFTANAGTVEWNAAGAQTLAAVAYNILVLSGSGAKSIATGTSVVSNLSIAPTGSATASIGAGLNILVGTITLGGVPKFNGTWGSSSSIATNKDDTYFAATTGYLTVSAGRTASMSGNWNDIATWGGVAVPVVGDSVTINSGVIVTVPSGYSAQCGTVVFTAGTVGQSSITLADSSSSLTVGGAVTIPRPGNGGVANQIDVGSGAFSAASLALSGTSGGTMLSRLLISTGTVTIGGNITSAGVDSRLLFSGAGTLNAGGTFMSGTAGIFTASTSTLNFNRAGAQTIAPFAYTFNNVILSGSAAKTMTNSTISGNLSLSGTATATAVAGTIGGNLDVGAGTTFTVPGVAFNVTGTTSVSGTLTHSSATSTKTFTGDVTINSGGIWSESAAAVVSLGGNLQNNGTFTASTGVHTFSGASKTLSGANAISIASTTISGTYTNSNILTVGTALTGAGTLTQGTNAILNIGGTSTITGLSATANPNFVNYTGGAQTVKPVTYVNLSLSGSGAKTLTGVNTVSGNLSTSGTATASTAANLAIGGNLNVGSGTVFTVAANFTLGVTGTTTCGGTLTLAGTGAKTFTGDVTVNNGGTWNETGIAAFSLAGNLQNNGTFTASTGVHTFTGTTKTLSGTNAISIPNTTISGTYTNSNILTVSTALAGTGTLTQGTNAILNITGTSGISGLSASGNTNTVDYTGAAQTVKAVTYVNLNLSGSGAKTTTGVTVNGILSMQGTATASAVPTYGAGAALRYNTATARTASLEWITPFAATGGVTIDNTGVITLNANKVFNASVPLTIIAGATLNTDAANNRSLTVPGNIVNGGTITANASTITLGGDWTGAGTFNAGTSTVVLSGAGAQAFPGVTFNNLTLSGSGVKTAAGATINGILSMEGTATASLTGLSCGAASTLQYKGSGAQSTGTEFPAAWSGSGGVIIANTSGNPVTLGAAKTINAQLTINNNATLNTSAAGNYALALGGNLANSGTLTANASVITVGGNWLNSGTFNRGTSSVDLNGLAAQTVQSGGSSWNILSVSNASVGGVSFTDGFTTDQFQCTTPGANMFFKANTGTADNYVITGANGLQLTGSSGSLINLGRLGGTGTDVWVINPTDAGGLWSVSYVSVANSSNIASFPILPMNSTDGGNTIYWFSADRNNNGIPDNWEYAYYHNLNISATSDSDSDGMNTLMEYLLGTDPTVPFGATGTIWVDSYASYSGNDGSAANPYKYLADALAAANNKTIVMLKPGTYTLSNFNLSKDLSIKGDTPFNTIIKGPAPYGATSDAGQMLNVIQNTAFSLVNCTVTLYGDQQPIISYDVNKNNNSVSFENVIFTGNSTGSKSLIAPNADTQKGTSVYMFNCLFYNNTANFAAELRGNPLYCHNNTVVNNTGGGLLVSGTGNSYVMNSIVRGNSGMQISFTATGPLSSVTYSNVQGGFTGTGNINSAETYLDAANGDFRLLAGSPGINSGAVSFVSNDISGFARPEGAGFDMGAYEYQSADSDGDGLTDAQEIAYGTNPNNPDTDGDGLSDYYEINTSLTDPTKADTDGDLISDGDEISLGTNPLVFDGQLKNASHRADLYNVGFEVSEGYSTSMTFDQTPWGMVGTYTGTIQVNDLGANAYDGVQVLTLKGLPGQTPARSTITTFVERNDLSEWWIATSFKLPRVKLPTNVDETMNIGGIYFTVNSNGYFCVYNGSTKYWMADPQVIPGDTWIRVFIHRYHAAKTADVWLSINYGAATEVFTSVPIAGPELDNYIRISFSSAQENDVQFDRMDGYNPSSPPF